MDDIDAKRDVRRRRILENSEKRLFKITGRNSHNMVEDTSHQSSISTTEFEPNLKLNTNGIIADRSSERRIDENFTPYADLFNDIHAILNDGKSVHSMSNEGSNSEKFYKTYSEALVKGSSAPTSIKSTSTSYTLLTNRINYVLLAAIVNVLLILRLDHLFGKAITVPYFTVMLGRLYICDSMQETQGSSLLFAALTLCNIKPEWTYKLKRFVRVLGIIVGDLTLYIFSFTLMYYALWYCFGDITNAMNL